MECFFLSLQSLSLCRGPHVTSHWGPSCWSPWPTPATPPWAGCTVTTHSNRSDQVARGAQVHQVYQRFHEVPSLRHDRLFRRPAGLVYLEYKHGIKPQSQNGVMRSKIRALSHAVLYLADRGPLALLWVPSLWVLCPPCPPGRLQRG